MADLNLEREGPWVALLCDMPENPKLEGLTDKAFRLYIVSLCDAGKNLTDGEIRANRAPVLLAIANASRRHVGELVQAGLWDGNGTGPWRIHDYLKYQPSRSWWEKQRETTRERVKRWREKQSNAVSNGVTNGERTSTNEYEYENDHQSSSKGNTTSGDPGTMTPDMTDNSDHSRAILQRLREAQGQ